MTSILGLHFGHDATVAVLVDGELATFVQRERTSRIKHAYSLDRETVELALSQANVEPRQIDLVTATSTQGCEPIFARLDGFAMRYDSRAAVGPEPLLVRFLGHPERVGDFCAESMVERVLGSPGDPRAHPAFHHYFAEYRAIPLAALRRFPWLDLHVTLPSWEGISRLATIATTPVTSRENDPRCRFGFHYPLRVTIDGYTIPGVRVDHHLAHAASSFYRSGAATALIVTNDGYGGRRAAFANGGVYLGVGRDLIALAPHFLTHGYLYDFVARHLGLGAVGGSGKLMGLAPYGDPRFFDVRFVGTALDHRLAGVDGTPTGWVSFAAHKSTLPSATRGTEPVNLPFSPFALSLAASTQRLFEETWLAVIRAATDALLQERREVDALCLSGGSALNCPSNSRVVCESGYRRVFIEPNCDDGGLSIGSSLWAYHALLGNGVSRKQPFSIAEAHGRAYPPAVVDREIAEVGSVTVERPDDAESYAAHDLAAGRVVAWFEGGGEMGPRALGHRSLLADPRLPDIQQRINVVKGRELWRPLAPMVLQDRAAEFFDLSGMPSCSPFMLLTARVIDPHLPAITHVDGSARLQTVTPETGRVFRVLTEFEKLTGRPVLLNTSLNAPGEPIAERPRDALALLRRGLADVLYLDGRRVTSAQDRGLR
jgi:carbamoyltransferase